MTEGGRLFESSDTAEQLCKQKTVFHLASRVLILLAAHTALIELVHTLEYVYAPPPVVTYRC